MEQDIIIIYPNIIMEYPDMYVYIKEGIKFYICPTWYIAENYIFTKSNLIRVLKAKRLYSKTYPKNKFIKNKLS